MVARDDLLPSVGRNQGGGICRDKGKDRGKGTRQEVQLMIVGNGVPVKYAGTTIAGNGSFAFMFQPAEAGFYYLYDGKEYHRMYIKAGDEIHFQGIDGHWKQVDITGEENRLLAQWTEMEAPFENAIPGADSIRSRNLPASIRFTGRRWLPVAAEETVVRDSLFRKAAEGDGRIRSVV